MDTLTERLALIIDARTDGAVTNMRKLAVEEELAAEKAQLLNAKITDLETRMARSKTGGSATQQLQLRKLRGEYGQLTSTLAAVPKEASRAERALAKVGLGGTGQGLAALGRSGAGAGLIGGAALFGAFEFLKSGIEGYTELASQIRLVARASGATAEQASALVATTNALGVSSDSAALGLFRLGRNIDVAPQKLKAYGIEVARTKNGNVDLVKTLDNVADAYQHTSDPARRAGLVFAAFGRAGATMLPVLAASRDQLEEFQAAAARRGEIFSSKDIQQARDYQIAMRELSESYKALAVTAAQDVLPALTKIAGGVTSTVDTVHKLHIDRDTFASLPIIGPFIGASSHLPHGQGGGGKASSAAQIAAQIQAEQDAAARQQAEQAISATISADAILASPTGLAAAKKTLAQAQDSLTNARAERAKALRDLESVRSAGGPGAAEIEAANLRVQAANERLRKAEYTGKGVASAKASQISAQDHLNKLRASGGVDTNKLADAEDRLRRANKNLADQQKTSRDAQRGVNQARGLDAKGLTDQLSGLVRDRKQLTGAEGHLANLGATHDLLAYVDQQNAKLPGTLVRLSQTATRATITKLNELLDQKSYQEDLMAKIGGTPEEWAAAGEKAGASFGGGFGRGLQDFKPKPNGQPAIPSGPTTKGGLPGLLTSQFNVNGPVTVQAPDPEAFGRKLIAKKRQAALSGGGSPYVPHGA